MEHYASKFVALFQSWVGLKESDGSHKKIIDIYNSQAVLPRGYKLTYKDPWCAGTVSAASVHLGYTDIIPTECSCTKMIELFKKLGSWVESDAYIPKAGDIIFYDWDDSGKGENTKQPDHVGVVEKVSGSTITVIEGNKNNAVERRTIAVNGKYIRGYGVPKYDAEPAEKPVEEPVVASKSLDTLVEEVMAGKWGNGTERKTRLAAAGCDCNKVQEAVNSFVKTKKTLTQLAKEVINGKYGNGSTRKNKLKKIGASCELVQERVNELLKQ